MNSMLIIVKSIKKIEAKVLPTIYKNSDKINKTTSVPNNLVTLSLQ